MSQRSIQDISDRLIRVENATMRLEQAINNNASIIPTLDTIEQLAKTIKYTIDYDLFPLIKQRPQKMEVDKPIIEEINLLAEIQNSLKDLYKSLNDRLDTRLKEFSEQLSLQLDLEPFRNNMVKIIVDIGKTHKLIEQGGKALLDLFQQISPALQELGQNSYSIQQQMNQLLTKPSIVLDPIINKLQELDSNLHNTIFTSLLEEIRKIPTYDRQFTTLSKDINTLKFIQRDPIDQSYTHDQLKEITRLVSLLNVDDINLQLSKITNQPASKPSLDLDKVISKIVQLEQEVRISNPTIKLDILQKDIKTLLSRLSLPGSTIPAQTVTTHIEHSTATYLIYSDEKSPDRSHFLL